MTIVINRKHDVHFNRKRIYRLMQILHLKLVTRIKKKTYIPSTPQITVENILNRDFQADKPNEKWLTDVVTIIDNRLAALLCKRYSVNVTSEQRAINDSEYLVPPLSVTKSP